jgi:hypothetical protein
VACVACALGGQHRPDRGANSLAQGRTQFTATDRHCLEPRRSRHDGAGSLSLFVPDQSVKWKVKSSSLPAFALSALGERLPKQTLLNGGPLFYKAIPC